MHRNYSDEEDSDDEERKSAEEVESGSDSDEEELKQHLASIQLLKQSGFYQTKGFTDETLPTTVELYAPKVTAP